MANKASNHPEDEQLKRGHRSTKGRRKSSAQRRRATKAKASKARSKSPRNGKKTPPLLARQDGTVIRYAEKTSTGQSWELLQGDCRVALSLLPEASVNCVVTSPPYYWQRDYDVSGQTGHEPTIDGYAQVLVECFRHVWRVLRDDGVVFLNLGDTYYSAKGKPHGIDKKSNGRVWSRSKLRAVDGPGLGLPRKSLIGIPWRVALAMQADGWTLRSDVVWKRPGALPEPTAHDRPWQTHEHVFIFSKQPRYWFDRTGIVGEEDLWRIPPRPGTPGAHFAPFPEALVEKCLRCGCPPEGTVLDPFVGSGTTMLVGLRSKRNVVGVELKPEYCQFILQRLKNESTTELAVSAP